MEIPNDVEEANGNGVEDFEHPVAVYIIIKDNFHSLYLQCFNHTLVILFMLCESYGSSAFVQVSKSNGWIWFVHWILAQKKTTNFFYTYNNNPLQPNERIIFAMQ